MPGAGTQAAGAPTPLSPTTYSGILKPTSPSTDRQEIRVPSQASMEDRYFLSHFF